MSYDKNKWGVKKLQVLQTSVLIVISVAGYVLKDSNVALSIFLAGIAALLPSFIFAKILFKHQGAKAARQIVSNFYFGELLKIAVSIILFVMIFSSYAVEPLVFFITYIAMLMTHWFAPLLLKSQPKRPESD